LEFGEIELGGVHFPIEAYKRTRHDIQGHPLIPMWIRIRGLPYRFFKKHEFEHIADDLGGAILMEVDPRSGNHYDFSILRIKVGYMTRTSFYHFTK
jgi:Domain of unknown function (DUF4283)